MWLVGMMGSGKTRAGRIAAARLDVGFADTDEEVERAAGRSVAAIWSTTGEEGFRRVEREVMARLAGFEGIVATGGGAILDEGNRRVMAPGAVVWLRASPQTLATRASGKERPLLGEADRVETMTHLLEGRVALYAASADHEIDTEGLGIDEVAERIEVLWSG